MIYDDTVLTQISPRLFDATYWQQQHAVIGKAQGRGTTWFIQSDDQQWVLRHYYRGGLIGKILRDQYLFTGYRRTRAYREFQLLDALYRQGLPVPRPIACHSRQMGCYCINDLITTRLPNTHSLVAKLRLETLPAKLWRRIGHTIADFHHAQVDHHDLNAHNILLDDQGRVWIIDFDQGAIRPHSHGWKAANLARLQRSLHKEQHKEQPTEQQPLHFASDNWQQLLAGYRSHSQPQPPTDIKN